MLLLGLPRLPRRDDVIAMSLAYYSRDNGVKYLALFLLSSNLLVRLKPWASALKLKEAKKLTSLQAVSKFCGG